MVVAAALMIDFECRIAVLLLCSFPPLCYHVGGPFMTHKRPSSASEITSIIGIDPFDSVSASNGGGVVEYVANQHVVKKWPF